MSQSKFLLVDRSGLFRKFHDVPIDEDWEDGEKDKEDTEDGENDEGGQMGGYAKGFRLLHPASRHRRRFTMLYLENDTGVLRKYGRYIARTPLEGASKAYTRYCRKYKLYQLLEQKYPIEIQSNTSIAKLVERLREDYPSYDERRQMLNQVVCPPVAITIRETTSEMSDNHQIIASNRHLDNSHREYSYYIQQVRIPDRTIHNRGSKHTYHFKNEVIPIKKGDVNPEDALGRHEDRRKDAQRRYLELKLLKYFRNHQINRVTGQTLIQSTTIDRILTPAQIQKMNLKLQDLNNHGLGLPEKGEQHPKDWFNKV